MKDDDIVIVTNVCFDNRTGKVIIEPEKSAKVSKSLEQALSEVKLEWIED